MASILGKVASFDDIAVAENLAERHVRRLAVAAARETFVTQNDYALPTRHGRQEVLTTGYVDRVEIARRGELIANGI